MLIYPDPELIVKISLKTFRIQQSLSFPARKKEETNKFQRTKVEIFLPNFFLSERNREKTDKLGRRGDKEIVAQSRQKIFFMDKHSSLFYWKSKNV
jgi:hypothetical protein